MVGYPASQIFYSIEDDNKIFNHKIDYILG